MGSQDSNIFMDFILQSHDNTGLVQQQKKCYYIHSLKFTTASTRNFLRQLSQSQLNWWYHISNKSTNDFISTLKIIWEGSNKAFLCNEYLNNFLTRVGKLFKGGNYLQKTSTYIVIEIFWVEINSKCKRRKLQTK